MSITRYFQKNTDGTITVKEIEERSWSYHPDALDTAIENESDASKKNILKEIKRLNMKGGEKGEISNNIADYKKSLRE